ncbi:MAG: hypothetical protein Kow0092_05630 [Deferrisomatales bacterium]
MWNPLRKKRAPGPAAAKNCPDCGFPITNPTWRLCPRCRRELDTCGGCSACGSCGKH